MRAAAPAPARSRRRTRARRAAASAIALVVLDVAFAGSHDWYDQRCCSDQDCGPLPADATITPVLGGYTITLSTDGRSVYFSRDKVKPSRDDRYHACVSASGTPFCIYVPFNS